MAKPDGGPAFPRVDTRLGERDIEWGDPGMTLRDWFAGQALANPALAIYADASGWNERTVANVCGKIADAMLKERGQ